MIFNNNIHTTACGAEPYNKCFGVGAQKDLESGGFSPYERINKLRDLYKNVPMTLESLRVRVWTEMYEKYEYLPVILKKAHALARYMEVCPLHYNEGELLLLDDGADIFCAQIYPEYVNSWVYDDLRNRPLYNRSYQPKHYDDTIKDEILSTEYYWKGKGVRNTFLGRLPEECEKGCQMSGGMVIYNPSIMVDTGIGHWTGDYGNLLKKGIKGIKADVQAAIDKIGIATTIDKVKALQFHEAQMIVLNAFSNYFKRYAEFAKEKALEYDNPQTKEELLQMGKMCEKLAEEPATDFWEAMMLVAGTLMVQHMETNAHAVSLGRMDQYLYPYYRYSLDNGIHTKEFMQELIDFFYLYQSTHDQVLEDAGDDLWTGGTRGYAGGTALVVGGVDAEGNDVTNDLTFMFLDATVHTRITTPWPTVRWHEGTPYELKVKTAEVMRVGTGHPKILNDKTCIEALMRLGVPLEEARDYVNIGCTELEIPGKTLGWNDVCSFNLPKIFELAMNNGDCLQCGREYCPNYPRCKAQGKVLGLQTGYLKDFKTYEDVVKAFEAQLKYWVDREIMTVEIQQAAHAECDDYPFMSTWIQGCTESGKSLHQGGAKYNYTGLQVVGYGTVADSLSVLKQVVFEEKKATPEEFYDALIHDWEGHERLYQLVNSDRVHHYGNDDDYADDIFNYVYNTVSDLYQTYDATRGGIGKIKTGCFSQIVNLIYGMAVNATPDGRKAHEGVSENFGASRTRHSGRDRSGPTAYAKSIGKMDHARSGGGNLINFKFGNESVSGEEGLNNLIQFLDGYFVDDPQHIQVMIANRETLIEAQKHPEDYSDLLVRVSGFSTYFTLLGKNFQDELIRRTEHSID